MENQNELHVCGMCNNYLTQEEYENHIETYKEWIVNMNEIDVVCSRCLIEYENENQENN